MDVNSIKKIAVLGTGLMAHGIVQEFAQSGYETYMVGRSKESIDRALGNIRDNLKKQVERGIITEESIEETFSRINVNLSIEEMPRDVDLVIESVLEDLQLKHEIFTKIEELCSEETILTSNTSSFPPTVISEKLKRPERFLNTHYFNPPQVVPLVELVKGKKTDDKYVNVLYELYEKLGKKPVILQKEIPGFIANRLQIALLREALHIVESGVATAQDVDVVIKNSIGKRWGAAGVFKVCELAGLDLFMKIAQNLQPDLESSKQVSSLLAEKVRIGEVGAKNGKGFYEWTPESINCVRQEIIQSLM